MFTKQKIIFLICFLILTVSVLSQVEAQTLAVFPVEDLSLGINSPNLELTGDIAARIEAKGLDVIRQEDVLAFMASRRIRWLGYLTTEFILQAREALGADLILLGTISQQLETRSPSYGLTLSMVRTVDAKTIWTSNGGLSLGDLQRLLGLNEPATLEELWPILVGNVLASWPMDLSSAMGEPLLFNFEEGEQPHVLQVKAVRLTPRYVRPGEAVKCVVEIEENSLTDSIQPQVYIRAGNRIHLAQQAPDALFYEASWTGSEIEKGIFREVGHESLYLAATELSPQLFEGIWTGMMEDDIYPVSLILKWPRGVQQAAHVGTYTVDSKAPDLDMVLKGKEINGVATFRDKVLIIPTFNNREPISHWQISVKSFDGKELVRDEGDGNLPRNFYWKGQYYNGFLAEEGFYQMILQVWDRAGNQTTVAKEVAYRPNPPEVFLEVKRVGETLVLKLDQDGDQIPLSYWQYEIWSKDGQLLKSDNGQKLPVEYEVPIIADSKELGIEGSIIFKDILGNQTRLEIADLYLMALQKVNGENSPETAEDAEEDEDSWVWLSQF